MRFGLTRFRYFAIACIFQALTICTATPSVASVSAAPGTYRQLSSESLVVLNAHLHDRPLVVWDYLGIFDHAAAPWAPVLYKDAKSQGIDAAILNPHGMSLANGKTDLLSRANIPIAQLSSYPIDSTTHWADSEKRLRPRHWDNEAAWAEAASSNGFIGLRAFEWTGQTHIDVIGSSDWCESFTTMGQSWRTLKLTGTDRKRLEYLFAREGVDWIDFASQLGPWLMRQQTSIYGSDIVCQFNHAACLKGGWEGYTPDRFKDLKLKLDEGYDESASERPSDLFTLFQLFNVSVGWKEGTYQEGERLYVNALAAGWKVGPTIGSDNIGPLRPQDRTRHTGVWVRSKDQAGLMRALGARRVFASTDSDMKLDLSARSSSRSLPVFMGDTAIIKAGDRLKIDVAVSSNSKVRLAHRVSLIEVRSDSPDGRSLSSTKVLDGPNGTSGWYDLQRAQQTLTYEVAPSSTTRCYYVRVDDRLRNDHTWSAPIFIEISKEEPKGPAVLGAAGDWRGAFPDDLADKVKKTAKVDLVFCIDATGSMRDDIDEVKARTTELIDRLREVVSDIRLGVVTYRDFAEDGAGHLAEEDYSPLTEDLDYVAGQIQKIQVDGGGDDPEDVVDGLMKALDCKWRNGVGKFIILIGDAGAKQPDHNGRTYDDVAKLAEEIDPVHVYAIAAGGSEAALSDFDTVATATGGSASKAADASGITDAIIEAVAAAVEAHKSEVSGGGGGGGSDIGWEAVTAIAAAALTLLLMLATVAVVSQKRRGKIPHRRPAAPPAQTFGSVVIAADGGAPYQIPLRGDVVIGRDPACAIQSNSPGCSRQQAAIVRSGDEWILRDLSNRGTTLVDGRPVTFHTILGGEVIEVPGLAITITISFAQ